MASESPPVLFIVYNRPRTTGPAFEAIRAARPKKLYVAADGPLKATERAACMEARRLATDVDWPCELKTRFSERNLGVRYGPASAIDWFLECEPEGIILEDDCVPSLSFFPYCAELLEYYRDDPRVMCITGDNFQRGGKLFKLSQDSYYFSLYPHCWGWATWARAWRLCDTTIATSPQCDPLLRSVSQLPGFAQYWKRNLEQTYHGSLVAWCNTWMLSCWKHNGVTVTPKVNLVSNIGFGADGAHCHDPKNALANLPRFDIELPLKHPTQIVIDTEADDYVSRTLFGIKAKKANVPAL